MQTRLLVVGVGPDTLGEDIVEQAHNHPFFGKGTIDTADLRGQGRNWNSPEDAGEIEGPMYLDVRSVYSVRTAIGAIKPTHVVCTAGINKFAEDAETSDGYFDITGQFQDSLLSTISTNAIGVMTLAHHWMNSIINDLVKSDWHNEPLDRANQGFHFAAISSNSAHIARTNSTAYCMSKAALSMGMRCIARDAARTRWPIAFTTYEPGFLSGTPMSLKIVGSTDEFQEARYHRIPSGLSMQPTDLAEVILNNMAGSWNMMNGACIRLDGGEQ